MFQLLGSEKASVQRKQTLLNPFRKTPIALAPKVRCHQDLIELEIRMPSTCSPVVPSPHESTERSLLRHCKEAHLNRPTLKCLPNAARYPPLVILSLALCALAYGQDVGKPLVPLRAQTATGPLRVNPANPRYFADGSGKAIYLTGSHTWANLLDRGRLNPPGVAFDYAAYMKWMVDHNFNFMRLWTAELPDAGPGPDFSEGNFVGLPWKWRRTGPGLATDGGLKFDLSKLDQSYFDRMRARTIIAGKNGIYVSVMLFNGYEWQFDTHPKDGDPFRGHQQHQSHQLPGNLPHRQRADVR